MIAIEPKQTLKEFIKDREKLNDLREGIGVRYKDKLFILNWR